MQQSIDVSKPGSTKQQKSVAYDPKPSSTIKSTKTTNPNVTVKQSLQPEKQLRDETFKAPVQDILVQKNHRREQSANPSRKPDPWGVHDE